MIEASQPLVAMDFCIFWGHCDQKARHRWPVAGDAATKFEYWILSIAHPADHDLLSCFQLPNWRDVIFSLLQLVFIMN